MRHDQTRLRDHGQGIRFVLLRLSKARQNYERTPQDNFLRIFVFLEVDLEGYLSTFGSKSPSLSSSTVSSASPAHLDGKRIEIRLQVGKDPIRTGGQSANVFSLFLLVSSLYFWTMVVITSLGPPSEGIHHRQPDCLCFVNKRELGKGEMVVSESRVSWVPNNAQGKQFSLEYPHIAMHAVCSAANWRL